MTSANKLPEGVYLHKKVNFFEKKVYPLAPCCWFEQEAKLRLRELERWEDEGGK